MWVVFGTNNLCCNWVKFSKESGFQFSHKLLCFEFCSCWFCSRKLDHTFTRFFLECKIIENLTCISFVHRCHVLKLENWHIPNQQRNFSENEFVGD